MHTVAVMSMEGLRSAPDAIPAEWVAGGLGGFAESVLSVVPAGFEAYARIFHPAWRAAAGGEVPVPWRDVAAHNGRVAHRAMQWPHITGSYRTVHGETQPGLWDREPEEGTLPEALAPVLASLLAQHTWTPEQCWFAVWEGHGCLALGEDEPPAFEIPQRRMLLLTGAVTAAASTVCSPPWYQTANLWWPQDRTWCVATEIDFMSTYVGGTRQCVEALTRHDGLEAMLAEPGDGVTWAGDVINQPPE